MRTPTGRERLAAELLTSAERCTGGRACSGSGVPDAGHSFLPRRIAAADATSGSRAARRWCRVEGDPGQAEDRSRHHEGGAMIPTGMQSFATVRPLACPVHQAYTTQERSVVGGSVCCGVTPWKVRGSPEEQFLSHGLVTGGGRAIGAHRRSVARSRPLSFPWRGGTGASSAGLSLARRGGKRRTWEWFARLLQKFPLPCPPGWVTPCVAKQ
jgi:hypothetical protein